MRPADTNQPYDPKLMSLPLLPDKGREHRRTHVMTGTSRKNRLFQCRAIYALGNSTPMAKTPMARTTRVNSRVIVLIVSVFPPPQSLGLKMFAPYGPAPVSPTIGVRVMTEDAPMMTPNKNAQHASPMYSWGLL